MTLGVALDPRLLRPRPPVHENVPAGASAAKPVSNALDSADVTVLCLDDAMTATVIREKLQRVARAARLSARERTVLDLLLLGRRNDEIAAELEIAVRTAKFHQANILKKLDVDSRLDLLRLLL